METFLLILAGICLLVGLIGSILPGLPGLIPAYIGLWIAHASGHADFSAQMLLTWGIITLVVTTLDMCVPIWETKRYGGSSYRYYGSLLGIMAGLLLGMSGMRKAGTRILNWIEDRNASDEPNFGFSSCLGILIGNVVKITCCIWMIVSFAQAVW